MPACHSADLDAKHSSKGNEPLTCMSCAMTISILLATTLLILCVDDKTSNFVSLEMFFFAFGLPKYLY